MKQQTSEFSPHMLMAAKEIEDVMKRYDIAGVAILHDPTGTKVVNRLDPTGTCSYMKGGAFGVKEPERPVITGEIQEREWDLKRRETIFATLNMVVNLRIVTTTTMVALQQAENMISKFFKLAPIDTAGPKLHKP